jgi:hypothetical protein
MQLSEIRKEVVAVATTVVAATPWILQAEGVVHLPSSLVGVISVVLGVAGWVAHYLAPNETTDPKRVAGRSVRLRGTKPSRPAAAKTAGVTGHPTHEA